MEDRELLDLWYDAWEVEVRRGLERVSPEAEATLVRVLRVIERAGVRRDQWEMGAD